MLQLLNDIYSLIQFGCIWINAMQNDSKQPYDKKTQF